MGVHGLRHVLTPGSPTYAALKFGALAGIGGLTLAQRRRSRRRERPEATTEPPAAPARAPHPRSKKKRSRRRG